MYVIGEPHAKVIAVEVISFALAATYAQHHIKRER